jgi:D-aspartate ligase
MAVELPRSQAAAQRPARRARAMHPGGGAVVLGSDYRGLALVRSLGRRGIPVLVLRGRDDVLAAKSRYATTRVDLPKGSDAERCAFLLGLAEHFRLDGWVLFPTSDDTAGLVGRQHAQLATRFTLTTPPWDVLRWAYDKQLTYALALQIGLPHPVTWTAGNPDEAAALPLAYPAIIKPRVREEDFKRLTAAKAWRVDSAEELRARFAEAVELVAPEVLLIQELIPGDGAMQLSYAALCDRGKPLATVTARRTRQYPVDFGRASTYVETIKSPEVARASQRLLEAIEFTGLVEVEFKRDPRDGALKLLDVNPRVWGWHSLCQRAGVDFPYLAWRLARGESVPPSEAQTGVRWLRFSTDLPTSLREIARGRLSLRTYLSSLRGPRESAIFARDDPWPGLSEFPMLVRLLTRRLLHGDAV